MLGGMSNDGWCCFLCCKLIDVKLTDIRGLARGWEGVGTDLDGEGPKQESCLPSAVAPAAEGASKTQSCSPLSWQIHSFEGTLPAETPVSFPGQAVPHSLTPLDSQPHHQACPGPLTTGTCCFLETLCYPALYLFFTLTLHPAGLVYMISLRVGELEVPQEGAAVIPYWTLEKLIVLNGMKKGFYLTFSALFKFRVDKSFKQVVTWPVWVPSSLVHFSVAFNDVQCASQQVINF